MQESKQFYLIYHVARVVGSMTKARSMIEDGEVTVDGVVIKDTFHRVPIDKCDVSVLLRGNIEYVKITLNVQQSDIPA